MLKTIVIRRSCYSAFSSTWVLLAICTLLAACASPPQQAGPIPPGPTPEEIAEYATAQMRYRFGLATGDDDAVEAADYTFRQIPREIFSRENPPLFAALMICERYPPGGRTATARVPPPPAGPQCRDVEWRYNQTTIAIRRYLDARIVAVDFAIISQASTRP